MFRVILYLLLAVILISVLRSVIGIVSKLFGSFLSYGQTAQPGAPDPPKTSLGGDLHRDPVCGTFVAESTSFHRKTSGGTFYYCSDSCKEKHALGVR